MKQLLSAIIAGIVGVGATLPTASAEEWRFNNFLPETRPETAELARFVEEANAAMADDLEIKMYSGGSLGLKNPDALRFLPRGAVEMSLVWANYVGRDAPALSSVFVQGAISTPEELKKVLPTAKEIYAEEFADWDVTAVGYMPIPMLSVSVFCRDEAVNSFEQLKDKKLRVWGRDQVETFTRLGVAAQIIAQEELYVALRTGVVDCALYPALYAHTISLQEVAKYASFLYPMASGPYVIGVSSDRWAETAEADRIAITNAANDLFDRNNNYEDDYAKELAAREKLVEQGVVWGDDFPAEDRALFLGSVKETWANLADEAGGRAPEYRARMLDALER